MSLRNVLLVLGLVASLGANAATFTLSAKPGEFNAKPLANPVVRGVLLASLKLTKFAPSKDWPPAAYVGFFQGKSRDNSVQFLIIRNQETDPYVVAGYRIVENGKEVKVAALASLPLDADVQVTISIDNGLVTLTLAPQAPVTFRTNLTEVSPYVSVSSGTAEFSVGR